MGAWLVRLDSVRSPPWCGFDPSFSGSSCWACSVAESRRGPRSRIAARPCATPGRGSGQVRGPALVSGRTGSRTGAWKVVGCRTSAPPCRCGPCTPPRRGSGPGPESSSPGSDWDCGIRPRATSRRLPACCSGPVPKISIGGRRALRSRHRAPTAVSSVGSTGRGGWLCVPSTPIRRRWSRDRRRVARTSMTWS
jgi:hypothetical protein